MLKNHPLPFPLYISIYTLFFRHIYHFFGWVYLGSLYIFYLPKSSDTNMIFLGLDILNFGAKLLFTYLPCVSAMYTIFLLPLNCPGYKRVLIFDLWSFEHDIWILRMKFKVEVLSLQLILKQTFEVNDLSLKMKFVVMLSPWSSKSVLNLHIWIWFLCLGYL